MPDFSPFGARHQPKVMSHQPLVTCFPPLVACFPRLVRQHQRLVTCFLRLVTQHLSLVTHFLRQIWQHQRLVTQHFWFQRRHPPLVLRHQPQKTRHPPPVRRHGREKKAGAQEGGGRRPGGAVASRKLRWSGLPSSCSAHTTKAPRHRVKIFSSGTIQGFRFQGEAGAPRSALTAHGCVSTFSLRHFGLVSGGGDS